MLDWTIHVILEEREQQFQQTGFLRSFGSHLVIVGNSTVK